MKTHATVHFETREFCEKARLELNGIKITPKYATNKIGKPVRLCRYETKQSIDIGRGMDSINTNLLAKNIPKEVSGHNFWNMFRKFGDIKSCKLVVDMLGNTKGYGYVNYYRGEDAAKALNELNDKEICNKRLKITLLQPGRRIEKRKNNVYVKHIPKNTFSDNDLKVEYINIEFILSIWRD
jgi:RNA recognition motif-containing protein